MMKKIILFLICFLSCSVYSLHASAKPVREVESDENEVVLIHTAIGYSTVIQFHSKPLSAVLGDQDAFKIEYIGNSITLKPLLPHAKSNLFLFTEYDRFNCTLSTGDPAKVDYLVKLSVPSKTYPVEPSVLPTVQSPSQAQAQLQKSQPEKEKSQEAKIHPIHKHVVWKGFTLSVFSSSEAQGQSPEGGQVRSAFVYEIELKSTQIPYFFSAASLGIKQGRAFLPIESIYLDSIELKPGSRPIRGKIVLLKQDIRTHEPLSILFAVPKHILRVPVGTSSEGPSQARKGK